MAEYKFLAKHLKAPKRQTYSVRAKVWVFSGSGAWYFVTIPSRTSKTIERCYGMYARGWKSQPVSVKLGQSEWTTSIFPYKKAGGYILPLKTQIRKRENIGRGSVVSFKLTVG